MRRSRRLLALAALAAACGGQPARSPYGATLDLAATVAQLSDADGERDAAVERLAALGPAALPALDAALAREPPAVREGVVAALAAIGDEESLRRLAHLASRDAEADVRAQALLALVTSGAPAAGPAVEAALDDPSPTVRLTAASACGTLCTSPATIDRLVALLVDTPVSPDVLRAHAAVARLLDRGDDATRARCRDAIATRAVPAMRATGTLDQRAAAALLAAAIGDADATRVLAAAATDAASVPVRIAAMHALGTSGGPEAVPPLAQLLDDPALRLFAYDALRRLDGRGVAPATPVLAAYTGPRPPAPLPPPRF